MQVIPKIKGLNSSTTAEAATYPYLVDAGYAGISYVWLCQRRAPIIKILLATDHARADPSPPESR